MLWIRNLEASKRSSKAGERTRGGYVTRQKVQVWWKWDFTWDLRKEGKEAKKYLTARRSIRSKALFKLREAVLDLDDVRKIKKKNHTEISCGLFVSCIH